MNKVILKEIRRIKSDVTPFLNTVYNNFIYLADEPNLGHNKDEIRRLLTSNEFLGLFVYDSNNIIAYLIGEFKQLDDGRLCYYVTYVYVGSKYRNHKIGSQLMTILTDKCRNIGIKYIILTCDTHNKKVYEFYKRRGYTVDPILRTFGRHEVLTYYL